jgi:hypothetical protein
VGLEIASCVRNLLILLGIRSLQIPLDIQASLAKIRAQERCKQIY